MAPGATDCSTLAADKLEVDCALALLRPAQESTKSPKLRDRIKRLIELSPLKVEIACYDGKIGKATRGSCPEPKVSFITKEAAGMVEDRLNCENDLASATS